ncbi:location of vulva defective 1-like, partial [Littorina saxatilis]|uniref:location of vulva defective 1-like n=1 Tax=Littorina saxatilis TaxID=31220 RepID=UPI0038B5ED59
VVEFKDKDTTRKAIETMHQYKVHDRYLVVNEIRNQDEYWNWTRSGLVNGIRAGAYYNDYPPLMLRGFVNDKVSKILGYATMRQVRIRPSLCEMDERMLEVVRECNIEYEISGQEEATFDKGWVPRTDNSTVNDTDPWYT